MAKQARRAIDNWNTQGNQPNNYSTNHGLHRKSVWPIPSVTRQPSWVAIEASFFTSETLRFRCR